jgi:2-polyprenyl-3-methyl-5-hydroxy-6-metoxy-1,4-benzoquinol methylase
MDIGLKYDRIAEWWHENHKDSDYGVTQISRAISYCQNRRNALDVGCGSGGRIFRLLAEHGFRINGIDASGEMIRLAGRCCRIPSIRMARG